MYEDHRRPAAVEKAIDNGLVEDQNVMLCCVVVVLGGCEEVGNLMNCGKKMGLEG